MLEGWEWLMIFGLAAMVMLAVLIIALLHFFNGQKTNMPQGYVPQQYSQQPQSPYNSPLNRICPQCGLSIADNAKFCSNCGKQLN